MLLLRGVCNFLGSVLPQQKFEVTDGPVLQLSFIGKQRKIPPRGTRAGLGGSMAGPHSSPWTSLCCSFMGFSLLCLLATAILDSIFLF